MQTIHFVETECYHKIDETATIDQMRETCPLFFKNAKFHQDKKYRVYRGQLFVYRKKGGITLYTYLVDSDDLFHLDECSDAREAKKKVDQYLQEARWKYGMFDTATA